MYGLVNSALKDMITANHGGRAWKKICESVEAGGLDFISMQYYPDQVTFDLVIAASKHLNVEADSILRALGKHWAFFAGKSGHGVLIDLFGSDYPACLQHFNGLHASLGLSINETMPSRFRLVVADPGFYTLEYHAAREELAPLIEGLLEGLANRFGVEATVVLAKMGDPVIFHISILEGAS